jgi:hypothetical protein
MSVPSHGIATQGDNERVHVPPPTCPYCGTLLQPDVAGISSAPITVGWFKCSNGCGTFPDFTSGMFAAQEDDKDDAFERGAVEAECHTPLGIGQAQI